MKKIFSAAILSFLVLFSWHAVTLAQAKPMSITRAIMVEKSNTAVGVTLTPTTVGVTFTLTMQEKGTAAPQQTKTATATVNQKTAVEFTGLKSSTDYYLSITGKASDPAYQTYQRVWEFTTTYGNTGNVDVGSTENWNGSTASGADPKVPTSTGTGDPKSDCAPNCPPQLSNTQSTDLPLDIKLRNPLKVDTVQGAIKTFMDAVVKIAIPFIVVFFIWSGLQFILAQGNPEKLKTAKKAFWWTLVGTLLILGAWAITDAIVGTINSIAS